MFLLLYIYLVSLPSLCHIYIILVIVLVGDIKTVIDGNLNADNEYNHKIKADHFLKNARVGQPKSNNSYNMI